MNDDNKKQPKPIQISDGYLIPALDPRVAPITTEALYQLILHSGVKFDTIVFRGMSGALVAPIVAQKLVKPITLCRKSSDDAHAGGNRIEGMTNFETYIIIDDVIETGKTIRSIIEVVNLKMEAMLQSPAECVGIFLYRSFSDSNNFDGIPRFNFCVKNGKPDFSRSRGDNLVDTLNLLWPPYQKELRLTI